MELPKTRSYLAAVFFTVATLLGAVPHAAFLTDADAQATAPATAPSARAVGTIKSISAGVITVTTDAGAEATVQPDPVTKVVRVAPGQTDLKSATPIQLADLQIGDRILARGAFAEDGKTVRATSIIVISKTDVAAKQAHDREEWQRHGVNGLVTAVDAASGTVTISTSSMGEKRSVIVHLSKDTILRRYAPDSVKFDEAKPAPFDQIKPGDQLRARGQRTADGSELSADEIVSGKFPNISGTIASIDAAAGAITLQDLATKKQFTVKITAESQLRKLPPAMAQGIAARLKGGTADAASAPPAQGAAPSQKTPPQGSTAGGNVAVPAGGAPNGGAAGAGARRGGGDFQQAILRMPAATISDLQKGDAVMIVSTEGTSKGEVTAITLLAGVDAILQASPNGSASTILSPWSLGGSPGGDAGTP